MVKERVRPQLSTLYLPKMHQTSLFYPCPSPFPHSRAQVPRHTIDWAGVVTVVGGDSAEDAVGHLHTSMVEEGESALVAGTDLLPGPVLDAKTRFVRSLAVNAATQQAVYIDALEAEAHELRDELYFTDAKRILLVHASLVPAPI